MNNPPKTPPDEAQSRALAALQYIIDFLGRTRRVLGQGGGQVDAMAPDQDDNLQKLIFDARVLHAFLQNPEPWDTNEPVPEYIQARHENLRAKLKIVREALDPGSKPQ